MSNPFDPGTPEYTAYALADQREVTAKTWACSDGHAAMDLPVGQACPEPHGVDAYGDYMDPYVPIVPNVANEKRRSRIKALTYRRSELNLITPPGWLIEGVMTRASLTLLSGKFGTYKSFSSVALAGSVATGRSFLGHPVAETGPVIYIAAEGASGVRARFEAWESAYTGGAPITDDMLIVVGGAVNLLNPDDVDALDELCKEVNPRLMVWDTLHRCAPGVEENSSKEIGAVIETLSGFRERFDATQLVDHHTGHSGQRSRGSSAIEDDFDNSWVIKLAGDGEDRSPTNQRTLEHRKVKDGELSDKIPIGLVSAGESAYLDRLVVEPAPDEAKGWLVMKAYAQQLDIAGVPLGYGRQRIQDALKSLGVEHVGNDTATAIAALRKGSDYTPYKKPSGTVFEDSDA